MQVVADGLHRKIAQHVAAARPANKQILLDCFAGIGGNAIAFALSGVYKRVYAIEKDLATLKCAEHNARIYGVHDRITFFHGDCFELLGLDKDKGGEHAVKVLRDVVRTFGVIFASPPWGGKLVIRLPVQCSSSDERPGPGYKDAGNVFDLDLMPYSMDYLYRRFSEITKHIILYLPRTSDLNQIAQAVEEGEKAQVVHYCIHENSKALCAYLGAWGKIADDSVRS